MKRHKRQAGRTFTLIELLVVIAIIAILAAMLLPSLNKAKEIAIASQCQNNKKTVSTALLLYADDFKETMPPYHNGVPVMWITLINPYTREPATTTAEKSILHCPADRSIPRFWVTCNTAINSTMVPAFSWAGRKYPQSSGATLRLFREVAYPSQLCLIGDGCGQDYSSEWGEGARYYNVHAGNVYTYTRHNGFNEVAYFDGHCGTISGPDMVKEAAAASTTSRFFDWDVSDIQ